MYIIGYYKIDSYIISMIIDTDYSNLFRKEKEKEKEKEIKLFRCSRSTVTTIVHEFTKDIIMCISNKKRTYVMAKDIITQPIKNYHNIYGNEIYFYLNKNNI